MGIVSWSQRANDCSNAVIVCGNSTITSNASGFGTQELDNESNPCAFEEVNSLWLRLNIDQTGELAFTLTPDNSNIAVDYDFYVFGPNFSCGSTNDPIRCSTTNPSQAGLNNNLTGLRSSENDDSEGPGELGNGFVSSLPVAAGETYYLLIDRPEGSGGFSLDWSGTSDFIDPPIVNGDPDPIEACFADRGNAFDLQQNEIQISSDPAIFFDYYESRADAFDGVNAIVDPSSYIVNNSTTIYIKATSGNSCFEILEQQITIDDPVQANLEYVACDQDANGNETFQISQIIADVQETINNPLNYAVTIHPSEAEANGNLNAIGSATYESGTGTLFARVAWNTDPSCYTTFGIGITVIASPISIPDELVQCDIDIDNATDGFTIFNLDQLFDRIEGVAFEYLFYETQQDRNFNNPIVNTTEFINSTAFAQTIYYKVITDTCEILGEVALQVISSPIGLNAESPLIVCDQNSSDGTLEGVFDLDSFRQTHYPASEIEFYSTISDARLEQNVLSETLRSQETSVFIRFENGNQCQTVEELLLLVNPLPEIRLDGPYYLCTDNPILNITAPEGFDSYRWIKTEGGTEQEVSNFQTADFDSPGSYSLEVGQNFINSGQTIFCTNRADFTILPSNVAIITGIPVKDASENNTVEIFVSGDGDYEYSIDGDLYQNANLFENIAPGILTVYVRDKNGCGIAQETITVLGYPKFFTPNGDNVHDFWQIIGVDPVLTQNAVISVYDRYGKFLKQFDANSQGWDGTINNRPMPSSDYWFVANIDNKREFKGHFALKR